FTDYAFRALIFLARNHGKRCTVDELAAALETSPHHMKKVVCKLAAGAYLKSCKGRGGGLFLGRDPEAILLSDVLLHCEENMNLFECYGKCGTCPLGIARCKLKELSRRALQRFVDEFKGKTLRDIL
ncbi:MAG: Rrf2 family transcriptional regulator, partial [Opitutales bacterium]|nr:Rrf2 family transcriptional regulator [Opitutales bacterium]